MVLWFLLPGPAASEDVILSWNANPESDLAGYRIYYGTTSSSHSVKIEVGNTTSYTLTHLESGKTYFFSATAFDTSGNESNFSQEVSFQLPAAGGGATDSSQDSDSDGMPDDWETQNGLDPDRDDAAADPDGDGISNLDEYLGMTDPVVYDVNDAPDAPLPYTPLEGETTALTPQLQTEDFYDPDYGDTHGQTRWQIIRQADDRLVLDVTSDYMLTALPVPKMVLQHNRSYRWRARFFDSHGLASPWSQAAEFATGLQVADSDENGILDDQEVDAFLDIDENGTADRDQADIKCVNVQGAHTQVGISIEGSAAVAAIEALESMDSNDPQFDGLNGGKPAYMPFGLIHFRLRLNEAGAAASVTVHLSEAAPAGSKWYKFDPIAATWLDYSDYAVLSSDRRSVTVTITDGGFGDLDGSANGIIIDPSGLGTSSAASDSDDGSGDTGNALDDAIDSLAGGAGCFIGTAGQPPQARGALIPWHDVGGRSLVIVFLLLMITALSHQLTPLKSWKQAAKPLASGCLMLLFILGAPGAASALDTTPPAAPTAFTVTLRSGAGDDSPPPEGGTSACVEADEGYFANLSCPGGRTISRIDFAGYGLPTGSCGDGYAQGSCHAADSRSIVEAACLNQSACAVSAGNSVFGDPCAGKYKRLAISYTCGDGEDDASSYTLTVVNGSGGGSYQAGARASIRADAAPSGQLFDHWEVNAGSPQIANVNSTSTTLTMPASAVAVTAAYKDEVGGGGLGGALDALLNHVTGAATLSPAELNIQNDAVIANDILFESSGEMIAAALAVVSAYEASRGPLWLNDATRNVTIPREPAGGLELERAIMAVMQGLLDHAYVPGNLTRFKDILDGAMFETSRYFPGAVDPPADSTVRYDVKINASQPAAWGSPVMYAAEPTRRPTGCYAAPGSIVTVEVPPSMADSGYSIRVGAHSWDLSNKPRYERLDRVSLVYPAIGTQTLVANPLGGGIYIEVPPLADAGIVTITIANAVRSPFYSKKPFHMTSLAEWRDTERHHPAPWADFESEKIMLQVPASWIYAFDSPDITLLNWDNAMDLVSDLMGKPHLRNGKTVLYMQIDVIIRGGAYYPGYPMSNDPYDPLRSENGNKDHYFLTGPRKGTSTTFHELGHAELFTKFPGETEAVVNLLYAAVMNQGFGYALDRAFSLSMGNKETISLDQAAIMWMVTENFRLGNPMDISNSTKNEVRYQQRGYGKYVEIANLFGWEALNTFWHSVNIDYMNGITYNRNNDEADSRILRMSRAAGADLRPLIHFWGVHPNNDDELKAALQGEGLQPSARIYDRLMHYKTLVPLNNAEFVAHADIVYPERDGTGNPDYGKGWYSVWDKQYNESHGTAAQAALQAIIEHYFPDGRPGS